MANKKKLDKEFEKIEAVGEGSVEDAKEVFQEEAKEAQAKRDRVLEYVQGKSTALDYHQVLSGILHKRLTYLDLNGFTYKTGSTKDGVVMELFSPDGKMYRQAFRPVRGPKDVDAIDVFAARSQSTIYGWLEKRRVNLKDSGSGGDKKGSAGKKAD